MSTTEEFENNCVKSDRQKTKIIQNLMKALKTTDVKCTEGTALDTDYATDFMANGYTRIGSRVLSNDTTAYYNSGVTKMMFRNSNRVSAPELLKVVFDRHLDLYMFNRTLNGELDTWFLANMRVFADIVLRNADLKEAIEKQKSMLFVCKPETYARGDSKQQFSFNVACFPSIIMAGSDKFYEILKNTKAGKIFA